ncbi:MAG: hypothetical protein AVDCRST_MAG18-4199, partial [uncultured Thermomicrobiales bacterium]
GGRAVLGRPLPQPRAGQPALRGGGCRAPRAPRAAPGRGAARGAPAGARGRGRGGRGAGAAPARRGPRHHRHDPGGGALAGGAARLAAATRPAQRGARRGGAAAGAGAGGGRRPARDAADARARGERPLAGAPRLTPGDRDPGGCHRGHHRGGPTGGGRAPGPGRLRAERARDAGRRARPARAAHARDRRRARAGRPHGAAAPQGGLRQDRRGQPTRAGRADLRPALRPAPGGRDEHRPRRPVCPRV